MLSSRSENFELIHPGFFETHSYHKDIDPRQIDPVGSSLPLGLQDRVVFIGRNFPQYKSILGKTSPEVEFQAAIYYSNQHEITALSLGIAFLIDLSVGTFLGFCFAWSWGGYARAKSRMDEIPAVRWREKFRAWMWARLVLLPSNLVLLVCLILLSLWAPDRLVRYGLWINPLLLVLVMSLKGLLGSRQWHIGLPPQSISELLTFHFDVFWQPFVIVLAILIALAGYYKAVDNGYLSGSAMDHNLGKPFMDTRSMLSEDNQPGVDRAVRNAIEKGSAVVWKSRDARDYGTFTPTRQYWREDGQECREFQYEATIDGKNLQGQGAFCRTDNAKAWRPVE
jgi:surface antigen